MFKTLLVEDNLLYRSVLKHALMERFVDMDAREAAGAQEAMNELDLYEPDLIFMDINLNSNTSGLELTRQIKSVRPQTTVIILSQHDIPEYRVVAQKNGADYFLSKSTPLEQIFEYVDLIQHHKLTSH